MFFRRTTWKFAIRFWNCLKRAICLFRWLTSSHRNLILPRENSDSRNNRWSWRRYYEVSLSNIWYLISAVPALFVLLLKKLCQFSHLIVKWSYLIHLLCFGTDLIPLTCFRLNRFKKFAAFYASIKFIVNLLKYTSGSSRSFFYWSLSATIGAYLHVRLGKRSIEITGNLLENIHQLYLYSMYFIAIQ